MPSTVLPVATLPDLFFQGITRKGNSNVEAKIGAEFTDGSLVEFGMRRTFGNCNARVLRQSGIEFGRLNALLSRGTVWVPSAAGIVRDEEFRTGARRTGLISAGRHNEVLRNLLVALAEEQPDRFDLLQDILVARFHASLSDVAFDGDTDQFVSTNYRDDSGSRHDLYSAGAGFVQVVQLLAFLLTREASVVLLDEPDAHLHSSLQRVIVEILDEIAGTLDFQVVLATHSKEIINFVDPSRLIFIVNGKDRAEPVSDEITPITILQSLGAIDNVDAYSLVTHRRCLFVEGPSDALILGRFAVTLGIKAFTGDSRIITIPTNGADHIDHVQQLDVLEVVLGPMLSRQIRDRDARTDEFRGLLISKSKRPLHVFELDCIESYLINASVISRVVSEIRGERNKPLQVASNEIAAIIDEECLALRNETFDRMMDRLQNDEWTTNRTSINLTSKGPEIRALLDNAWQDRTARLRYVSGKHLLSRVRQVVQDRYGVNFGNERLAEAFAVSEIPAEVAEQLQAIARLHDQQPGPKH